MTTGDQMSLTLEEPAPRPDADPAPPARDIMDRMADVQAELLDEYQAHHKHPWVVAYSGGKDSTLLLQLVMEMLLALPPSQRKRPIHIVTNDTQVESPLVAAYVDKQIKRLTRAMDVLDVPVTVAVTRPALDDGFWVNLIGRGYASPSRTFRWCTDRLKIRPTTRYIAERVAPTGKCILLIGVRRDESANRARSIAKHTVNAERLNPHGDITGCMVFRPVMDITTEETWQFLLQRRPPWGGSHREMVTLYRNALSGECPLVIDKNDAPSCGTGSARFGCWTCTVVDKDKSMEGWVEAGFEHMDQLLAFRDWLATARYDGNLRQMERRNGRVDFFPDGKAMAGPFTIAARQDMLTRLLSIQSETDLPLISDAEVERIKTIWAEDTARASRRRLPLVDPAP